MKYYFMSGYLPEVNREDLKLKVTLGDLIDEKFHFDPSDWKEVELLLLGKDIFIIEKLLAGKPASTIDSLYGVEFWKDQIKSPKEGPDFIIDYLQTREEGRLKARDADRLYAAYYDYVLEQTQNDLVNQYALFERNLRNILAALRARQKGLVVADHLVGESDVVDELGRSSAEDFGISGEFPWIEELLSIDSPTQGQEVIERIRWDFLDERSATDQFHFNFILTYLLKLQILEKRLELSAEVGMAKVRQLEGR